ncbi:MAG: HAD family hydrolase [Pseudomonadota bacterium]
MENHGIIQDSRPGPMKIACLFDVDGTILDSRKCGTESFKLVLRDLYGWEDPLAGIPIAGRTDLKILADVYAKCSGKKPEGGEWEAEVARLKDLYCVHLERMLREKPPFLCPGFPELFDSVAEAAGLDPGLGTGNFEEGARLKIEAAGIDFSRFPYGGFGGETEDRPSLLQAGKERAKAVTGREVKAVVIGDTPEDCKAAKKIGAFIALVSTGPFPHDELEKLDPDFIARDFSDPAPFLQWLASLSTAPRK